MAAHKKRAFSLPAQQASYVDYLVASGAYASANEVIRASLRALQENDAAMEREEMVPLYDAMQADPARGIPAEQVMTALEDDFGAELVRRKGTVPGNIDLEPRSGRHDPDNQAAKQGSADE